MHALVIVIAKYFLVFPVIIAVWVWLRLDGRQKWRFILLAVVAALVSLLFAKIGSKLYYDPRPFIAGHFTPYFTHAPDNGFPSDHTLLASFLAFTTFTFSKKWGIVSFVFAILIGLARVVAGVHHLADILGAMLCAALAMALVSVVLGAVTKKRLTHEV